MCHLGFAFTLKCPDDERFSKVKKLIKYTGEDAAEVLFKKLEEKVREVYEIIKYDKKCSLSDEQREAVRDGATHCHICEKELGPDRVIDHDHITGKFRGVAHNGCNLNYKVPKFFPVVVHNLANYDEHLLMWGVRAAQRGRLTVLRATRKSTFLFQRVWLLTRFW